MERIARHGRLARLLKIALIAVVYVATARLALRLDPVGGFATLVWPPSGIALACLLRGGIGLWPGVALGAFAANATAGAGLLVAAGIAVGNTGEAIVGAAAVRAIVRGEPSVGRLRDALALAFAAALASSVIAASIGVGSLALGGRLATDALPDAWLAWWLGDAAGDLVLAPVLLLRRHDLADARADRSWAECLLIAGALIGGGLLIFGPGLPAGHGARQVYLLFPVLIWAAARLRGAGAAVAALVLSVVAITGTAYGHGPFVTATLHESLIDLQGFMLVMAASGLLLGASKAEIESNQARAAFLARTSEVLAGSHDYGLTLDQVARLAVPFFADWCIVDVVEGQVIRRVAVAAADPDKRATLVEVRDRYPPNLESPQPAARALREGRPYLQPVFDAAALASTVRDETHLALMQRLDPRSAMSCPMVAHGRTVGVLTFARSESGRHYTLADLALGVEIARRAAIAVDNARLTTERRLVGEERARLYESERTARAEAEEASRAKDEFLAMLGHELRNPLSPMVTALQLMKLRGPGATTALSRELEVIERQVKHLVRLVDDLLDVSRITRGKIALRRIDVELAEIVAKAVEMAGPLLEQRRHLLALDVPRTGLLVSADPDRLAQVVTNLLTNAAKYTPTGGKIRVTARVEAGEAVVRIIDNGIGIPATLLPSVFEPFVQGQRSPERSEGGLGIGLALVRSLVQLHGGTVAAASEGPDRGSEFVVRLPLVSQPSQPPSTLPSPPPGGAKSRLRVLVVDDNRDAAELTAELLAEIGYDVSVAFDPASALARASETPPDVAILDVGLPVIDGYELARQMRERIPGKAPRFIAMTGYGQENDRTRSEAAGFEQHLVKPVDMDALVKAIDSGA